MSLGEIQQTVERTVQGTGIGLALCHRIVTAHGGRISLDQRAKQGAAFTIDLPADTVEVDSP